MRPPLTEHEEAQLLLRTGKQIPLITAPSANGQDVHLWQYKQRRHLALHFLHTTDCERCLATVQSIFDHRSAYSEQEAVPIVVFQEAIEQVEAFEREHQTGLTLLGDADGSRVRRFLSLDAAERPPLALFIADRYSTLWEQSVAQLHDELPTQDDVMSWFGFINTRCTL